MKRIVLPALLTTLLVGCKEPHRYLAVTNGGVERGHGMHDEIDVTIYP